MLNDGDKTANEMLNINILNVTGQVVQQTQVKEDSPISFSQLADGIYFIEATDTSGAKSQYKLILKK